MTKYVYDFSEGNKDMKDLLGGKGANLAEMTNMGLPVPPGFTITTEACLTFLKHEGAPPEMLEEAGEHLVHLQEAMGRNLGDPDDPLLVSVRSGAKFSMPGMMDTVLNLGLNDGVRAGPREADRRRHAVRERRLPPVHPDVRQDRDGRAGRCVRARARRGEGAQGSRHPGHGPGRRRPGRADRAVPRDLPGAHRARRSRRIRRTSCAWRSTRSSRRGTASARSTTGVRTRSPTTSAPR